MTYWDSLKDLIESSTSGIIEIFQGNSVQKSQTIPQFAFQLQTTKIRLSDTSYRLGAALTHVLLD